MMSCDSSVSHFSLEFCVKFNAISTPTLIRKGRSDSVSALPMSFKNGTTWILKYYVSHKDNILFYLEFQGSVLSDFKVVLFVEPIKYQSITMTYFIDQQKLTDKTVDIEHWVEKHGKAGTATYIFLERTNSVFQQCFSVRVSVVFLGQRKSALENNNSLLLKKTNTDVTLICGGEEVHVHSAILGARAPILFRIWRDTGGASRNSRNCKILLPGDFSLEVLKQYVYYLYVEKNCPVDLVSLVIPVFADSEYYHPHKLIRQCIRLLRSIVREQNVYDLMCFASRWCLRDLYDTVEKCFGMVPCNSKARELYPAVTNIKELQLTTSLYCGIYEYARYLR